MDREIVEQKLESLRRCLQRVNDKCSSDAAVSIRGRKEFREESPQNHCPSTTTDMTKQAAGKYKTGHCGRAQFSSSAIGV